VRYRTALDAVVQTGGFLITLGVTVLERGLKTIGVLVLRHIPRHWHTTAQELGSWGARSFQARISF
jgi:hypothetical protein